MSVITTLIATIVASPIFASAPVQAVIAALGLGGATVAGQVLALGLIGALGIFAVALGSYMLVNNKGMGLWNSPSEKDGGSVSAGEEESEEECEEKEKEKDEGLENRDETSSRTSASNSGIDEDTSLEEDTSSEEHTVDPVRVLFPEINFSQAHWKPIAEILVKGQVVDNSSDYEYLVVRRKKLNSKA